MSDTSTSLMKVAVVGHVDHGKSTIVGRLLADTGSLPQGKLEQIKLLCEKNSKPFEYAFLLDALKDEQSQGITIDSARVFFKTKKRNYIIIDAPGHVEFLKNMVSGAARADAALLVIDAKEGVKENSRRHGYLLSMLGVKQILVLINKMDLVNHEQSEFNRIVDEYKSFLGEIGVKPLSFIPVSGFHGDNIVNPSEKMGWYKGKTVVDMLDGLEIVQRAKDGPFRMFVQDVYKFTKKGDDRRIVAGQVLSGRIHAGDEVVFLPSGKKSMVRTLEAFNAGKPQSAGAGASAGFTLNDQLYVTRGELAVAVKEKQPHVTSVLRASIFWLGKNPFTKKKNYFMKMGTAKIPLKLVDIHRIIDASKLERLQKDHVDRHDVAECTLKLEKAAAFDLASEIESTSRFVIVDEYDISGGGIILEALPDGQAWVREKVQLRNSKWESSSIAPEKRAERYSQKATLVLITGSKSTDRKQVGKLLELQLFNSGKLVYMLSMGNMVYGVDADIRGKTDQQNEHFRRLAEVAHVLLDAGLVVIVTAADVTQPELEILKTSIGINRLEVIWLGEEITSDISYDLRVATQDPQEACDQISSLLADHRIIFKPW